MLSKLSVCVLFIYIMCMLSGRSLTQDIGEKPNVVARIGGGTLALPKQFPFVAYIIATFIRLEISSRCTGTILSTEWVLTAVHCFMVEDKLENYFVRVTAGIIDGADGNSTSSQVRRAAKVILHKDYKEKKTDLALVRVDKPFVFNEHVKALKLTSEPVKSIEKATCNMIGFGITEKGFNELLYYIPGTVVKCSELHKRYGEYRDKANVCVTFDKPNTSVCSGDSGGPLVCADKLAGVASSIAPIRKGVDKSCGQGKDTFGYYISTYFFGSWISKHMGKAGEKITRSASNSDEKTRNVGSNPDITPSILVFAFVGVLQCAQ